VKELSAFKRINLLKCCDSRSRMAHFGLPRVYYPALRPRFSWFAAPIHFVARRTPHLGYPPWRWRALRSPRAPISNNQSRADPCQSPPPTEMPRGSTLQGHTGSGRSLQHSITLGPSHLYTHCVHADVWIGEESSGLDLLHRGPVTAPPARGLPTAATLTNQHHSVRYTSVTSYSTTTTRFDLQLVFFGLVSTHTHTHNHHVTVYFYSLRSVIIPLSSGYSCVTNSHHQGIYGVIPNQQRIRGGIIPLSSEYSRC
jgi:hypothetical protein